MNDFSESASGKSNVLQVSNEKDGTRNNIPDEVKDLAVSGKNLDRQTHTHHMVTGQTAQTNQFPEFLAARILTPCNPPSYQYQNLSTQVSQDNKLPMV